MKYNSILKIIIALVVVTVLIIFYMQLNKEPVSCSQIKEDVFSISRPDEMEQWLKNSAQLTRKDVEIIPDVEDTILLKWKQKGSTYYVHFYDDKVKNVHIYWGGWGGIEPTLNDVLNCFGTPDLYYAQYGVGEAYFLALDLWYLDEGFLVTSTQFGQQKKPIVIDEDTIMNSVYSVATPSNSVEEMNKSLGPAIIINYPLDVLRPWPDNLKDIDVMDFTQ